MYIYIYIYIYIYAPAAFRAVIWPLMVLYL